MIEDYVNFFPTPVSLIEKMVDGINWYTINSILEPSAGKGDICDVVKKKVKQDPDIDCVEKNQELRAALKGKGYRVVYDDFLTFETSKHYDLILMNPPFDMGAAHLLKALRMQEDGGIVVCILNAETIKNPCNNARKALHSLLEKYGAQVQYLQQEFESAERKTSVEIALIKVEIPEKKYGNSIFFEEMRKAVMEKPTTVDMNITDVAVNDYIEAGVQQFQIESKAGLKLIREYREMAPHILNSLRDESYNNPIITLSVNEKKLDMDNKNAENRYLEAVRRKYWRALFYDPRFTKGMPSAILQNYSENINELADYDFSYYNIKEIQIQMKQALIEGIGDCIMDLFTTLTCKHAWSSEFDNNIHYYNGWATNKAWYIGNKVILPAYNVFSDIWKQFQYRYEINRQLTDIEKAFDYLKGTPGRENTVCDILETAEKQQQTKNIHLRYFDVTFYKKGTMHITFTDDEVLKRLNIYAGKKLNMLPPGYGKKSYDDMDTEEKSVIDSFEGEESYRKVCAEPARYLYDVGADTMPLLAEGA